MWITGCDELSAVRLWTEMMCCRCSAVAVQLQYNNKHKL